MDGRGKREQAVLIRQILFHPGRRDEFKHQLLHQPFIERLGQGTEQQNQGAQLEASRVIPKDPEILLFLPSLTVSQAANGLSA